MPGRPSVRPSICLSHQSTAASACGGFASERPASRRYRSIAAGALRAPCCRTRRSAAKRAASLLTADGGAEALTSSNRFLSRQHIISIPFQYVSELSRFSQRVVAHLKQIVPHPYLFRFANACASVRYLKELMFFELSLL